MKRKIILILVLILVLSGCNSDSENLKYQSIKINNIMLNIPTDFSLVNIKNTQIGKFKILYEYRKQNFSESSDSLIIGQYIGPYPSNEDKFFSIVMDKFVKKVPGSKLLSRGDFSINKNIEIYWFKYVVSNDIFNDEDIGYYGLQAYIFRKDVRKIYVMNALVIEKEEMEKLLNLIKEMKITSGDF